MTEQSSLLAPPAEKGKHRAFADALAARFSDKHIDSGRMHGATVVVVKGSEVLASRVLGAHDESSIYNIFSLTKIVTTIAVLQQVERGKLSLDDPVSKYLPSFARVKVCDHVDPDHPGAA